MAFTEITMQKRASDLVVAHLDHNFSNDDANITPPALGAAIPFGSVVFRAKGGASTAAWTLVTTNASLVTTNEFAVVFGNHYGFAADFDKLKGLLADQGLVVLTDVTNLGL